MNGQGQIGKNSATGNQQQVSRPNFQLLQTFSNQAVRYNIGNNTGTATNKPPTDKFSKDFTKRFQDIKMRVNNRLAAKGIQEATDEYSIQMRKEVNKEIMLRFANTISSLQREPVPQKVGPRDDNEAPANNENPLWPKTHIPNPQNGGLTHQHFWRYSNLLHNRQYVSILFGFNRYIEKSRYELNQPTTANIIRYLAQTAVEYNILHKDKPLNEFEINQWIKQLKSFFSWTNRHHIYSDIAKDISYQNITSKMEDIIKYPNGEKPKVIIQDGNNATVEGTQKQLKTATQSMNLDTRLPALNPDCIDSFVTSIEESREKRVALRRNPENNDAPENEKKVRNKSLLNEESKIRTFQYYIKEHSLKNLNKRDMLKFLVRYRDINTESTMNENVITLRKFFRWVSTNRDQNNGVAFPYIENFVPNYDETRAFAIKTIIEGNAKLGKVLFNNEWIDQFFDDIMGADLFISYNKPGYHTNALKEYLDKKAIKSPTPCDVLDFFILEKPDIADANMRAHIATYQRLFRWTSIKANKDGSMYYPDIIGSIPKPGILGDIVYTLKEEYNERIAKGDNPKSPAADYFNAFKSTVSDPDNGKIAINFINFIEYLRTHINIRKAPPIPAKRAKGQEK